MMSIVDGFVAVAIMLMFVAIPVWVTVAIINRLERRDKRRYVQNLRRVNGVVYLDEKGSRR